MSLSITRPRSSMLVLALTAGLLLAAPTQAANTYNVTIQIPADVRANPCTPGDLVNFRATLHMVMSMTADARGGYHVSMTKNWVLAGDSITTGIAYRGSQTDTQSVYVGSASTVTTTDGVKLLSRAAAQNFLFHANTHVTVNAAGVPTATVDNVRLDCSG